MPKKRKFEKKIMHVRRYDTGLNPAIISPRDYTVVALFDVKKQTIQYGVAICHPSADAFSKKRGVQKASQRAYARPVVIDDVSQLLNIQKDPKGPRAITIFRMKAESFAYDFVPEYLSLTPEYE